MAKRRAALDRSAADFLPEKINYRSLVRAAADCQGCDLYQKATQTVFGEGPSSARIVLVGETAGDREDIEGKPFVGPAGRELDNALESIGLNRKKVYITNAVKHFKFEPRGKRRLHKKPSAREMAACLPWLEAELDLVRPEVLLCLGASAAKAIIGRDFRITQQRGEFLSTEWCENTLATYHPSAILRVPDRDDRHAMRAEFVSDLKLALERAG